MSAIMSNIRSSTFRRLRTVIANQSPLTGKVYRAGLQDWRWRMKFDYVPLKAAAAGALLAEIAAQREGASSFAAWDPSHPLATSGIIADGAIFGGAQTGYSLATKSWPHSQTIAQPGDTVAVYYGADFESFDVWRIFRVLNVVTSDASGNAYFSLDAPLPASPADLTTVSISPGRRVGGCGIRARLLSYDLSTSPGGWHQISIEAEEVL